MENERFKKEFNKIKSLFEDLEEKQKEFLDDAITEYVKIKIELQDLYEIEKKSGVIKIHPTDPSKQKELPISKTLAKLRPSYLSYHSYLLKILGNNVLDEDDEDLAEFE